MPGPLNRRQFISFPAGAAAWFAARAAGAAGAGQRRIEPGSEELTQYQLGPHIWLRWHNEVLLSYRAHPTQKYPYFFPFGGPVSGLPLTTDSPFLSAELLIKLSARGERMAQVGVTHYPRAAGTNTGASFRKILRTFRDIGKLRLAMWTRRSEVLGPPRARSGA